MTSYTNIQLSTSWTAPQLASLINFTGAKHNFAETFSNFIDGNAGGLFPATYNVNLAAVQAVGKIVLAGEPSSGDTFKVGNITITAETSTSTAGSFNIGTSITVTAANAAACVNSYGSTNTFVTATSSAGTVIFTSILAGAVGNALQLSSALTNGTSGLVAFAGGTNGTSYAFAF